MTATTADDAAQIQKVKLISRLYSFGNVPYKTFERASTTKYAGDQISGIYLGQSSGREFQHVVGRVVGEHAYDNYVARTRRSVRANDRSCSRQVQRRSSRADLIDFDLLDGFFHYSSFSVVLSACSASLW